MRNGILCFFLGTTLWAAAGLQPRDLRTEYRVNPQGIDTTEPRLSWILAPVSPKARGLSQTAYRVLVASSERALRANTGDLWDSGKVDSSQSTQVVYRGKPLVSGAAAFWKVEVWDQDRADSGWSAPAQWSMGLLDARDWQGKWIGRDERGVVKDPGSPFVAFENARWIWDTANADNGAPAGNRFFRAVFTIPAGRKVTRALAMIGADTTSEVYLNGENIANDSNAALPQVKDVTLLVREGGNLVAVQAAHPRADRPAGLIGAVRVDFASGDPLVFVSSNLWRASAKVEAGWEKPGYLDSAWQAAKDLGAYGMAPWGAAGFKVEHRLPARMLRKEFALEKRVRRAVVYYSGLGSSELYLNGAKVGDHVLSPGLTDYDKHVLYETFDVTREVAQGRNAIGLMLGNGRYYAPRDDGRTRNFGFPKAIVQLNIEFEDGSRQSVVSDESWKLTTAGPVRANNEYDGEEYDARMELPGGAAPASTIPNGRRRRW